ncbi:FkbM family methyltransferase [Jannaschia pohangensis]|uniref:Methyltransferase, FkbM family n=1 Tax=Jannaschia pohangensis TaxID=390807 RepID=A0A1I3TA05_9RHOB|nr:FkbM family methyltransferase [Jannaschia pohangensis]SFJ67159.1 methyltransferase, FkbM family [Jannaschia pohangensis]
MAVPDKLQAGYLRRYDFTAPVIIDVGVLNGTPFLYDAFPDRKFLLIDPLEESRAAVTAAWSKLDFDFHVTALGARKGSVELELEPGRLARTSGGRRIDAVEVLERRKVPVSRLDTITDGIEGPFGLKIDTEGHELEVLKGATRTLKRCEFVIAEVSIKKRFEGGYRFSEVIAFMASQGFEVHSFLSGLTRAPRMSDVLFIPADSPRFDMVSKDA